MYVRVDNDLVCIDKLIRAEFIPAPYNNNSILSTVGVKPLASAMGI